MIKAGGDARPMLNIPVQTEINRRENEFYKLKWREYVYNFRTPTIPKKFYARHDQVCETVNEELLKDLEKYLRKGPRDTWSEPQTSNHKYGWLQETFDDFDRNDKRFYFPKSCSEMIRTELLIQKDRAGRKEKPFTGVPFR